MRNLLRMNLDNKDIAEENQGEARTKLSLRQHGEPNEIIVYFFPKFRRE